mmetsp:Transcript_40845/g.74778  ORF Transcript_40845/g.74778 Transcript_40845/m.74778 type:complete len:421 (+) Transcript_40845:365-1627(+)
MRMSVILPLQFWVFLFHFIHAVASTPLPTDEHGDFNGSDIIEWIKSHPEGDIHPSLRIGRELPGDPTSILGLFVSSSPDAKPIEKGDVIAQIPWGHMIHPDGKYKPYKYFSCRAIYNLAKELNLGEKSKRAPYVRYLLSQPRGTMPGEWTNAGQEFFAEVLGHGDLPPYEDTWRTDFERIWVDECSGDGDDAMERAAYWLASSRDEDSLMVPIYDMANHSNDPDKLNTLSFKPAKAGDAFRFVASRKIVPGEQIYNSYNRCNQCSDVNKDDCESWSFFRTPNLMVQFGFVEDYPQNWEFDPGHLDSEDSSDDSEDDTELEFCLQRDSESGELDAFWEDDDDLPDEADAKWLKAQYERLQKLYVDKEKLEKQLVQEEDGETNSEKMTRWEWESIWRYHQALSHAIDTAIQSAVTGDWRDEF